MNRNPYADMRDALLEILQPDLNKRLGQGTGRHALNTQRWQAAYTALPPQILQEQRQGMKRVLSDKKSRPYARRRARKHVRMIQQEIKRRKISGCRDNEAPKV